jgi:hypothetical protein
VTWRQREGTLREDVPGTGECVLVDRERGRVLALNVTGAAVWDLLDGRRDAPAIARLIAEAADAPVEQVEADVARLVEQLVAEGFLLPVDGP